MAHLALAGPYSMLVYNQFDGCKLIDNIHRYDYTPCVSCKAIGISIDINIIYKASGYKGTSVSI